MNILVSFICLIFVSINFCLSFFLADLQQYMSICHNTVCCQLLDQHAVTRQQNFARDVVTSMVFLMQLVYLVGHKIIQNTICHAALFSRVGISRPAELLCFVPSIF